MEATNKRRVEALGEPHTEVEPILAAIDKAAALPQQPRRVAARMQGIVAGILSGAAPGAVQPPSTAEEVRR